MLYRRVGAPKANVESEPSGFEVRVRDRADLQRFTRGESEMVEAAQSVEEIADLLLAANIDGVSLGAGRQPLEGRVDPLRAARRNDDGRSVGCGALGGGKADPRGAAQDHDPLRLELRVQHEKLASSAGGGAFMLGLRASAVQDFLGRS